MAELTIFYSSLTHWHCTPYKKNRDFFEKNSAIYQFFCL